jgi:hypothetical protein
VLSLAAACFTPRGAWNGDEEAAAELAAPSRIVMSALT